MCAAVVRAPFRVDAPFERELAARLDPFRDWVVRPLDDLEVVRVRAFDDVVRAFAVFAVLRAAPVFGALARLFAEPELAEPVRDAGFGAAVLRDRLAVLLLVLARDRFVVAMSPSLLRTS